MYINNVKFAKSAHEISGELALESVERIQEIGEFKGTIKYTLKGSVDRLNRPTLILSIYGIISALCQNCLQPLELSVENQTPITIFFNEDQLDAALFSESESDVSDGVLAEDEFDVMQLVEDEVIMLLPYAAKHDSCIGLSYHDKVESPFNILKQII
ncbi:MAG: metal-binding protein [Neisseriaceae bacterium]|nr:MAG: metal-binding protein [Neisseriaceae bacterium]